MLATEMEHEVTEAAAAPWRTLLVVLPGADGRLAVLQRLQRLARVCVLVPAEDASRSTWARAVVGEDNWIDAGDKITDVEDALSAVKAWMRGSDAEACEDRGEKAQQEFVVGTDAAPQAGDVERSQRRRLEATAAVSPLGAAAAGRGPWRRRIDGVMTYDEFAVEACAFLAESLRVPGTPLAQVRALRNKLAFRERCAEAGVPAVRHILLRDEADMEAFLGPGGRGANGAWPFPSVLKPRFGAGSWYVQKIESAEELREVFGEVARRMRDGCFPAAIREAGFTLEAYFGGLEVDVDGWAWEGTVQYALVSDNRPAEEPFFLELGGHFPSQLPERAVRALENLTERVLATFPGFHGCFHFEAKIDLETMEVMPIELNARCGGAETPASVEAVSGLWLPEVAARLALGMPTDPAAAPAGRHAVVASTNLHVPYAGMVEELSDANVDMEANKVVTSVLFKGKVGKAHEPNNGSASCCGWLAAGGGTLEEAEKNLQTAVGQLSISVRPFASPAALM